MVKKFKPGDLVRFIRNEAAPPPYIIPRNHTTIGIVHNYRSVKIGEGESAAQMIIVAVRWSDPTWNNSSGFCDENPNDLELIQSIE